MRLPLRVGGWKREAYSARKVLERETDIDSMVVERDWLYHHGVGTESGPYCMVILTRSWCRDCMSGLSALGTETDVRTGVASVSIQDSPLHDRKLELVWLS